MSQANITFNNVTCESDKFVCVRETGDANQLVSGARGRQRQARPAAGVIRRRGQAGAGCGPRAAGRGGPAGGAAPRRAPRPPGVVQVIVDTAAPAAPERRPISADSAIMNPNSKILALKAATPGVEGDALQIFDMNSKAKLKAVQFPQSVVFWKWVTPKKLGMVTATSVYHWDIEVRGGGLA